MTSTVPTDGLTTFQPDARGAAPDRGTLLAAVILGTLGAGMFLIAGIGLPAAIVALDRGGFVLGRFERHQLDLALAMSPAFALAGFAQVVGAVGLVVRVAAATRAGIAVASLAAAATLGWIVAIVAGHDPFGDPTRPAAAADGIQILAVGTALYVVAAIALARALRSPSSRDAR